MLLRFLLAAAGLAVLAVAADHLVLGSSRLAARLRVSPVVVGVVVIGFGTSFPELLVSGVAASRGDTGIALGNIIGSNLLNLTLILGIAALMGEIVVTNRVVRREIPLAIGSMVVFVPFAWLGLGPVTGIVLLLLLAGSIVVLLRWSRHVSMKLEIGEHRVGPEALRALLGLAGTIAGAQLLVVNAAALAADFGVPQLVIGFTLIALGTSLPELVTTIQAMRRRETDLVVGNLFGSNLFNSLAGGGAIGIMSTLASAGIGRAQLSLLIAMVGAGALAWLLLGRRLRITRLEGVLLLVAYALSIPLLL